MASVARRWHVTNKASLAQASLASVAFDVRQIGHVHLWHSSGLPRLYSSWMFHADTKSSIGTDIEDLCHELEVIFFFLTSFFRRQALRFCMDDHFVQGGASQTGSGRMRFSRLAKLSCASMVRKSQSSKVKVVPSTSLYF